ncbi:CRAL/TRIO domain-containing protein [Athelia psychrophila]|uniref:Phosphatidylinositol transfer protein SFH5 n=1 Tax=Athelia psychrophila TaxID=1759441 RepID=A0A166JPB0_9AGAM|nr:CRAL/TRIO domain-containing protein [Fibularhizoctonia sp. CBS 109695]
MLTATVRWRALFKVEELANEEFPENIFGTLGHLCGTDREGHPVVYNLYGGNQDLKAIFADVQRFLRWRVKLMEQSIAKLDFVTVDQMLQVHDYAGVSMRDRDANSKNATQEATSIFQNHYPEFLSRKFFINVPSLLSWIFWLFKSLVSASTFAKMSVVGSGEHAINKALSEVIDEEEIPKRYGGLAEGF